MGTQAGLVGLSDLVLEKLKIQEVDQQRWESIEVTHRFVQAWDSHQLTPPQYRRFKRRVRRELVKANAQAGKRTEHEPVTVRTDRFNDNIPSKVPYDWMISYEWYKGIHDEDPSVVNGFFERGDPPLNDEYVQDGEGDMWNAETTDEEEGEEPEEEGEEPEGPGLEDDDEDEVRGDPDADK